MVKAARFLDGANSYYVVVDGEEIPALWADDLYLKRGYFDQPGWGNDSWTELFFQKIETEKVVALCKNASPYYKGIEALYRVGEVDTRNGVLKFRLLEKIVDLRGISA